MASEKCVAPKNVEPFPDVKGESKSKENYKEITVFYSGKEFRKYIGLIEIIHQSCGIIKFKQNKHITTINIPNGVIMVEEKEG